MTYTPTTDYSPAFKAMKVTLSKRIDVNVDFRSVARPVTKVFDLEYAIDKQGVPATLVDFYATACNGIHAWWWAVGAAPQVGGYASLKKVDDLSWRELPGGLEAMWLDQADNMLVLLRDDAGTRLAHMGDPSELLTEGSSLESLVDLGDPKDFFPKWIAQGFPHPATWNTDTAALQVEFLERTPKKQKVVVGSRIWPRKARNTDTAHSERGVVTSLQKASNAKQYAEVRWDQGATSWIRTALISAIGDNDPFEAACESELTSASLVSLSAWLKSNSLHTCDVEAGNESHKVAIPTSAWWLARVFSSTPTDALCALVGEWASSLAVGDVKAPEASYSFDSAHWSRSFDAKDAVNVAVDALILCWFAREGEDNPSALIKLCKDTKRESGLCTLLHLPRPFSATSLDQSDATKERGESLGLPGPVGHCHD